MSPAAVIVVLAWLACAAYSVLAVVRDRGARLESACQAIHKAESDQEKREALVYLCVRGGK